MNNRLARRVALTVGAASAALGLAVVPNAAAQDAVPGVVDLTISSLVSKPETVSPPGALFLLEATVQQGAVPTSGQLTFALPADAAYRDDLSSSACNAAGPQTATCVIAAEAGSQTFEIAAHAPSSTGFHTTTATVRGTDPDLLEYDKNNTATVGTTVTTPSNDRVVAGLVTEGGTMTLNVGDGREYTLEVPPGVPGVIAEIRAEDATVQKCGSGPCGNGFVTDFVQHPHYKAEDPNNPLITRKSFGPQDPCKGLGNRCSDIYFAKSADALVLEAMPYCPLAAGGEAGTGQAIPSPCINRKYKVGGIIWFDVRMLSNDPIELPPFRL